MATDEGAGVGNVGEDPERIIERITDGFVALDSDDRCTYVNERGEELLGESASELLGVTVWEAFSRRTGPAFCREFHEAVDGDEPATMEEYYPPLDARFRVNIYPAETGTSVFFQDVTEQYETVVALQQTTEDLERILETSPIGIVVCSASGDVHRVNERASEILGHPGDTVADLIKHPDEYDLLDAAGAPLTTDDLLAAIVDESGDPTFGYTLGIDLDEAVWLSINAAPVFADGDLDRIVLTVENITRRRQRQFELRQQNERLEEFASVVSHDLRNPLNVAEGYLEVAREGGDQEAFDTVEAAHRRMRELINDLLELSRTGRTVDDTEPVSVAEVARDAWMMTRPDDAGLQIRDDVTIFADPERLETLFENLFRNAVEHGSTGETPAGDAVEHDRRSDTENRLTVEVGGLADGFYVADDGRGVPQSVRGRIFERGVTTSAEGTGFGLSIVETVARAHGWSLVLTESDSGGARFEIHGVTRGT